MEAITLPVAPLVPEDIQDTVGPLPDPDRLPTVTIRQRGSSVVKVAPIGEHPM